MRFADLTWDTPAERTLFVDEARELLAALEDGALADAPDLDALFRAAHTLKGSAAMAGLDAWAAAAHAAEDRLDAVRQGRAPWDEAARQAVLDLVDLVRGDLGDAAPAAAPAPAPAAPAAAVRWILDWDPATPLVGARAWQAWRAVDAVAPGTVSDPPPDRLAAWSGPTQTLLVPAAVDPAAVRAALADCEGLRGAAPAEAPAPPDPGAAPDSAAPAPGTAPSAEPAPAPGPGRAAGAGETLRIPAAVLETLLEGLGELLLDQSQLAHQLGARIDPAVRATLDHLRRTALGLQDATLRARMLPLHVLFRQLPRAVHDLARQLGKQVRLETMGGDTELDRVVMDRLHEPLLHLLRNACDHGIEPPAQRRAAGKPETGLIRVRAAASQGHVHLWVEDDGAGIAWDRVRARAVERGWLAPDAPADPDALAAFLVRPGFSTAAAVSAVSGRGVGLDVVQAFADETHGTFTITSTPGQGTVFHLELPMTLAILAALVVEAGPWTVGLPLAAVDRIETRAQAGVAPVPGGDAVPDGAAPLPVIPLAAWFDPAAAADPAYLVRVRDGDARAALAVDRVLGQQELVVKPLGLLGRHAPWLSGVALLGDGRLALVVDVRRVVPPVRAAAGGGADDGVLRAGSNQMEVLVFQLGDGQRYGINVYKTREVLRGLAVTATPGQHPWLLGFARLRGDTVPVLALDRALGLPPADGDWLLLTEFDQSVQAFRVGPVERMVRVAWDQVEPLPPVLDAADNRRFVGVIDHPELGPVQLVDFEAILDRVRPPAYPAALEPPPPAVRGAAVWLADDSRVARAQVLKALGPLGVAVREFPDGQALWDAVEAGDPLPRLFVLDVEMPRLDGYALAVRLKADPRTRALPVVLHTSLSGHWHAARAQQVDADAILTKFDAERLARTVAAFAAASWEVPS